MCFLPGESHPLSCTYLLWLTPASHTKMAKTNVAMGTFCLATSTAWQLAKLLLWHNCQSTYTGIGVCLALHISSPSKFPIRCTMVECVCLEIKYVVVKGWWCVCDGGGSVWYNNMVWCILFCRTASNFKCGCVFRNTIIWWICVEV